MPKPTQEQAFRAIEASVEQTLARLTCASRVFESETDDDDVRVRAENVVRDCVQELEGIRLALDRFSLDHPTPSQVRLRKRVLAESRAGGPHLQAVQS